MEKISRIFGFLGILLFAYMFGGSLKASFYYPTLENVIFVLIMAFFTFGSSFAFMKGNRWDG